jgi:hypothetical protein
MHLRRTPKALTPPAGRPTDPVLLEAAARSAAHELVMSARLDDIPTDLLVAPLEALALDHAARDRYRAFRP